MAFMNPSCWDIVRIKDSHLFVTKEPPKGILSLLSGLPLFKLRIH